MKKIITRRSFLKAAGVASAVTIASGALAGCAEEATSDATTESGATEGDATEGGDAATGGEITLGLLGPKTAGPAGDVSVYGIAVINGANLYFNQVNEAGGINGKMLKIIEKDEQGDETQAVNAFTQMIDEGIVGLVGDVTTTPTLAVVAESQDYNMPIVTASATAAAVTYDAETDTVFENVYRSTFIDPFQGQKMADYAFTKLGYTKAAIIVQSGADYNEGLATNFEAKFIELGGEVLTVESYSDGDVDFKAQLTNILGQEPEVVFCPNYYEAVGSILKQAREIGLTVPFLGGDGWDGIVTEETAYATAEELDGCFFCANYAGGASPEFEEAYVAAYGTVYPNGFAPLGYDAAMTLCEGVKAAEEAGVEYGTEEYKQAIIDGIDVATVNGITGTFTFDEHNNPIKVAYIITFEDGKPVVKEQY